LKTGLGCLDGTCSLAALVRKPVILFVVIVAAVMALAVIVSVVLFYCPHKGLQAFQVKSYESYNLTLFESRLMLTQY